MTLKMTTAQVVETSVTVTNSSFQNYTHPDDHTTRTTDSLYARISLCVWVLQVNFFTDSLQCRHLIARAILEFVPFVSETSPIDSLHPPLFYKPKLAVLTQGRTFSALPKNSSHYRLWHRLKIPPPPHPLLSQPGCKDEQNPVWMGLK